MSDSWEALEAFISPLLSSVGLPITLVILIVLGAVYAFLKKGGLDLGGIFAKKPSETGPKMPEVTLEMKPEVKEIEILGDRTILDHLDPDDLKWFKKKD